MLKICTTKVRKFCVCEMKKYNEIFIFLRNLCIYLQITKTSGGKREY